MRKCKLIVCFALVLTLAFNIASCNTSGSPNDFSTPPEEYAANTKSAPVNITAQDIDKEDFTTYLRRFMSIVPIFQKDEITLERATLFITYYTDILETALGHTFETAGDEDRYTQTSGIVSYGPRGITNLIPVETVSKVADTLFDIDFGSQDFDEFHYVKDNYGILPDKAYMFASEAFSGAYQDYDILTDTFTYEDGVISVQVQFYEFDTYKTLKQEKVQYKFNAVLYEDEIICYQLNDVYIIDIVGALNDIDSDDLSDEIIFALGFITDDGKLVDKFEDSLNIVNSYPKLAVNFGSGETAVKRFNSEEYLFYRTGGYAVADFDGDRQLEIAVELKSMGSSPKNHIYVLKYDKAVNDFIELSMIRGYEFDIKDNIISCPETGFNSEIEQAGYVESIEYFTIAGTEQGTSIEIYQYTWAESNAGCIGYAISVFVWKDGGFTLLSQRFEPYKEPVPINNNPADLAPAVTEDIPPPPAAEAARTAGLEEKVYGFIPWHHNYNNFMNNDELKPNVNTLYAIWHTYLLETELGAVFDTYDGDLLIPVETVKNTVSYLYGLDGNSEEVEYDDFYISKDNPGYFRLPDGFSPDIVWAFIQWETLTADNGIYKFDVIFYNSPADDSDRGEELRTFNYQFEQVLYKDSSPSKVPRYRFIGAKRVK